VSETDMRNRNEFTRRGVLKGAAALAVPALGQTSKKSTLYAYLGSFTTKDRNGRGDGIHAYRVDPETGGSTHVQHLGDLMNPSFLITSPNQQFLYSSHGDGDYVTSYSVDQSAGMIKPMNKGTTGGMNGAHLALSPNARFMVVTNYATGTIAV